MNGKDATAGRREHLAFRYLCDSPGDYVAQPEATRPNRASLDQEHSPGQWLLPVSCERTPAPSFIADRFHRYLRSMALPRLLSPPISPSGRALGLSEYPDDMAANRDELRFGYCLDPCMWRLPALVPRRSGLRQAFSARLLPRRDARRPPGILSRRRTGRRLRQRLCSPELVAVC